MRGIALKRKFIILMGLMCFLAAATGLPVTGYVVSEAYASSAKEEGPKPEFEYVELKPLILPIITERGLTQQVSLLVSVEIPYGKKSEIEPYSPRLADAYISDLYGALGSGHAMMRGNIVDVQAVKERLTAVTNKVIGAEKFNTILLQVVQQRSM